MTRTNRPRWLSVLAVFALGAIAGGGLYQGNQAYIAANPPASCGAGCVNNGSLPLGSDSKLLRAEQEIADANTTATSGGPGSYVSVVLLDPFTHTVNGSVSQTRMTAELMGASLAQQRANQQAGGPKIQLLLANEGTSAEEGADQAVRRIESLEGQDRIVAVAGMGLSNENTDNAAKSLAADGLTMFGAVTTGDRFDGLTYSQEQPNGISLPAFYQVIPAVEAQVQRLREVLGVTLGQPVALVGSNQRSDMYSTDLQTDFQTAFGLLAKLRPYPFDPATAGQRFATIATTVCGQREARPLVLYAGRETMLPTLVQQFQQSAVCDHQRVTIVTGSDANALPLSATSPQPGIPGAEVTVMYSDIEDVSHPSREFAKGYNPDGGTARCENQVYDPWAVATYNSVMAAADAVRSVPGTISKQAVLQHAAKLPAEAGAAGPFRFNVNGQLASTDIPVYKVIKGACSPIPG